MAEEKFNQFLSDLEQQKIEQFLQDEVMREAVKKVLLSGIYDQGTLKKGKSVSFDPYENFALVLACQKGASYEQVGQDIKACWEGINLLVNAYKDLEQYRPIPAPKIEGNKAR